MKVGTAHSRETKKKSGKPSFIETGERCGNCHSALCGWKDGGECGEYVPVSQMIESQGSLIG